MAHPPQPVAEEVPAEIVPDEPDESSMAEWYDRSSLVGDFMVMLADQTEEDYLRRAPENRTCEFIDGIVYMPSPVDAWHQRDIQLLVFLLEGFGAIRQTGIVLTGPTALRLRTDCYLEPDAFVLPVGGEAQIHGFYSDPPALLVVEVLSRSTRSHDLKRKSSLYREAEVSEIYFVDDRDQVVIVERKISDGYRTEPVESGPILSQAIPGFWFNVDWLWARPRPNVMQCLDLVLAGPPA
jgi:Uma2 family endonuclease